MEDERKLYLPYLLHALAQASFEGWLTLMEGDVQRTILFHGGKPVNVLSGLQEETLGRILLEEGKISTGDYKNILDEMVQTSRPAGEILISMNVLGPQDVFLALEFQTRKKLLNCFKMVDFGFNLEEKPITAGQLITPLDLAEMIFTGIQIGYSVDRLLTEFPVDEETVFITHSDVPDRSVSMRMGPRESKIYRSIGTGSTLAKLMGVVEDLQYLLSVLYALHALHLIEASGISQPSTTDLELPPLAQTPAVPTEKPQAATPSNKTAPATWEADYEISLRAPTLDQVLRSDGVSPKLAHKALSLASEDHFKALDVRLDVGAEELEAAYFKLLENYRLHHIDAFYTSEKDRELAHRLLNHFTAAYRELANEHSRAAYIKILEHQKDLQSREVPPRILADVEAQKGELALGTKRYQEAMALFESAIRLYPEEPTYHFRLGLAGYLKALDETPADQLLPEATRKPFLKAMAINPRYDHPRLYLGYISKRNGDLRRALKEFEGALECNPNNQRATSEIRLLMKRLESE